MSYIELKQQRQHLVFSYSPTMLAVFRIQIKTNFNFKPKSKDYQRVVMRLSHTEAVLQLAIITHTHARTVTSN